MNIYVCHSTSFDYVTELYQPLKAALSNHDLFLPHEQRGEAQDTKQVIKNAKLILAEVSYPSTGQGIELGWANDFGVPIICIHRDDATPSGALHIVSDTFISYSSADDLIEKLHDIV